MRMLDCDGMFWCCLQSGANDGAYLKPVLDFYGYKKFAYYILGDYYKTDYCVLDSDGPFWNNKSKIKPVLLAENGDYKVTVSVLDGDGKSLLKKEYQVKVNSFRTNLPAFKFNFEKAGYYSVEIETERR
jgi:hypothetical protein